MNIHIYFYSVLTISLATSILMYLNFRKKLKKHKIFDTVSEFYQTYNELLENAMKFNISSNDDNKKLFLNNYADLVFNEIKMYETVEITKEYFIKILLSYIDMPSQMNNNFLTPYKNSIKNYLSSNKNK